jgi:hypothetical protein
MSAPIVSASFRLAGEKSAAMIGWMPLIARPAMTDSPTGPQPTTSGTSPGATCAIATACQPTAIGSVSAACSVGMPSGTGTSMDSFSTMRSAKPPGRSGATPSIEVPLDE